MSLFIRPETPGDQAALFALIEAAFRGRPCAGGDEQLVVDRLRGAGALGRMLTGDPGYYRRFGFEPAPDSAPPDEPPEYFMLKRFAPMAPTPRFRFHWAFYGDAPLA